MSICIYCEIDQKTLKPKNVESEKRLSSLRLDQILRSGDRVLDVGCNSGLLAITAANYHCDVVAIDVQQPMVDSLRSLLIANNISRVTALLCDLFEDGIQETFDHVFFLQVLHWACFQGHSIDSVVNELSRITKKTLTIEFPWDVNEPAIRNQTDLTREKYDSKIIFRALCREFNSVELMGFQDYFDDPSSHRVLVRCVK